MKIGELSRRTGVSVRMLRYYEGEGLLAPPRTDSGYRDYGPAEEETVRRIKMLGAAGMTLETIQQLLPVRDEQQSGFQAVQRTAQNTRTAGRPDRSTDRDAQPEPDDSGWVFVERELIGGLCVG